MTCLCMHFFSCHNFARRCSSLYFRRMHHIFAFCWKKKQVLFKRRPKDDGLIRDKKLSFWWNGWAVSHYYAVATMMMMCTVCLGDDSTHDATSLLSFFYCMPTEIWMEKILLCHHLVRVGCIFLRRGRRNSSQYFDLVFLQSSKDSDK